ncbi:xylitol oxidase [Streptoalloteichus tenebrarius]|uniref:Xylitol oxidase n=2 Tax=Actinomycetes TaxID=1760 RepID=A0ABT1HLW2_STRSD|nr:FAD-binding protein [Streptoalloteichus tenebrarius]MCP2256490.1 xylitol oxidase [Streptoalloteichus tenebrarius]BFF04842.1 alditol oxidase [Streptoalloteichus tenebrarius]
MSQAVRNWAGNVVFSPRNVHAPVSVEHLQELVNEAGQVRVMGTGHSFSALVETSRTLLRLDRLPRTVEVDADSRTAWVSAATTLGELAPRLHERALALPILPSLPHISVGGACATATHGSGNDVGSLASAVRAVRWVTGDGEVRTISRGSPRFEGVVVSLGALGVVTHLELDLVPTFEVEQHVYEDLPWSSLLDGGAEIFACASAVSVFTDWRRSPSVWVKRRSDDAPVDLTWTGARKASRPRHPIAHLSAENCTPQLGVPGPWHERLPHFRPDRVPSAGAELQSEYLLPRDRMTEVLRALRELAPLITPVLQVSEIRTVGAEPHWLSPSHHRASVAVHFTWRPDAGAVSRVLPRIEHALDPWSPRPHWGKISMTSPRLLASRYPYWAEFRALRQDMDPSRKFANRLIEDWFLVDHAGSAGDRADERR